MRAMVIGRIQAHGLAKRLGFDIVRRCRLFSASMGCASSYIRTIIDPRMFTSSERPARPHSSYIALMGRPSCGKASASTEAS